MTAKKKMFPGDIPSRPSDGDSHGPFSILWQMIKDMIEYISLYFRNAFGKEERAHDQWSQFQLTPQESGELMFLYMYEMEMEMKKKNERELDLLRRIERLEEQLLAQNNTIQEQTMIIQDLSKMNK
ncbi:hypothetical protein BGZ76_010922 [Entomortierella beljakovae]|nr:hypothetical protein BGZ76_010922 [Entomortierella beljakovae]